MIGMGPSTLINRAIGPIFQPLPSNGMDSMTAHELKTIRADLGLTAEAFATILGVADGRTVRRWEGGERAIPGPVAVIAKAMRESAAVRRYFRVTLSEGADQ
jgi:DNA-binding transcriptional regulator YiaG